MPLTRPQVTQSAGRPTVSTGLLGEETVRQRGSQARK